MIQLSIIIPVYNVAKELPLTITSILKQTFQDFIIILINDGSTDGSAEICDNFAKIDERIKVYHKKNGGVSSARNMGLDLANTPFVAFVDGDDTINENMYELLLKKMSANVDISSCRFISKFSDDSIVKCHENNLVKLMQNPANLEFFIYEKTGNIENDILTQEHVFGSVCRSIFRKEIIDNINLRFNEKIKIAEDLLFMMSFCNSCFSGVIVDKYLYSYNQNRENSAIANYNKDTNHKFMHSSQILLDEKISIIKKNKFLGKREKRACMIYMQYHLAYQIVIRQFKAAENLKELNKIIPSLISWETPYNMLRNGESIKMISLMILFKFKFWRIINFVFKRKFTKKEGRK